MMLRLTILFLSLAQLGLAQKIVDVERRHAFAKSYFGTELMFFPSPGSSVYLDAQGQSQAFDRAAFLSPAINIGGTHFWGHVDFFVSLATSPIAFQQDPVENSTRFRAITGVRLYPVKLQEHRLRPFGGVKVAPVRLNQANLAGENFRLTQVKSIFELGLGYRTANWYAHLGYNFLPNNAAEIYLSREVKAKSNFPKQFLSLGINYTFETTAGSYPAPVRALDSVLRQKNTMGWFLGLGPSSAFPLRSSSYLENNFPFLDDRSMPNIFPELTLGYHFSRQEVIVSAAFRPIRQEREALGFTQTLRRNSLTLEAYKFLFDYHGFAPFIGAGIMFDNLRLLENDREQVLIDQRYRQNSPSIVFGWDIRPARRADDWLLRTNLRYNPAGWLDKDGDRLSFQQLEFNFIQLVIYPQRMKAYQKF